jgi:Tol biopolymer transport system component
MVLWAAAAAAIIIASLTAVVLSRSTDQVVLPAPVPLTSLPDEESHPHLSADGSRVFFAWSQGSANADIYVKLIGAPEPLQLTNHPARDAHPAVTGDGKRLAFLRDYGSLVVDLIIMPAAGGAEVNLGTRGFHSISWSQDGRSIAASLTDSPTEPLRIELLSVNSRRWQPMIRRVEGMRGDLYPAFSPDGRRLAFARRIATNDAAVAVMNLDENLRPVGEPVILVRGLLNLVTPSWTPDGRTILYLAGPASNRSLWAVRADGSGTPVPLPQAGDRLDQIATASNVWRLVASRSMEDFNIWSAELSQDGRRVSNSHPVISNTWNDEEGRISPNGKWLAFVSHRTGSEQIWVSQIDGRRPEQITDFAESDNLRVLWSPDSARLLITGNIGKRAQTFLREYPGGKTSAVHLAQNETACGWSRDGKFVYYSAELLLGAQLWRKPLDGGPARLVTKRPAVRAIESPDGKTVYFCSRRYSDGIWAVPVEGGVEKRVVPSIEFRAFAAGHAGLFYINGDALRLQPHSGGAPLDLLRLPRRSGFGFDICEEAGLLVYTQLDHAGADLVMIDDYRF